MNTDKPRYVVELHGNDHDAAAECMLRESFRICEEKGLPRITLLIPAKKYFSTTPVAAMIDQLIGRGTAKDICGGSVRVNGIELHAAYSDTFDEYEEYQMLVGIYLQSKSLDKLDTPSRVAAIVYLPWTEAEGKGWLSTWRATVLGQHSWQPEPLRLEEQVVAALQALTEEINLSTGLCQDMDKKLAVRMFANLRRHGFYPDPEEVRRWALPHGWRPADARDLAHQADISLRR